MPDDKKPGPSSSTSSASTSAAHSPSKSNLAPAGESGDPAVHQLLAELETARSNNDGEGVKAAQDALAKLGFSAA